MTGPEAPKQRGTGWMVALFALPILCCAGPALLAALGAGTVGALLGGATGSIALAIAGLAVLGAAVAVLTLRRRATDPNR